ncbi:MAG: exosortase-associated EpsI family protein [Verrucomicrobiales bacterium]|nr:exosortase-associated EpsI family protein [Verrucomicrobiales bacterium]
MNRGRSLVVVVVGLLLMSLAALALARFRGSQRLGEPGLKLTDVRLSDPEGVVLTTNSIELPERLLEYSSVILPVTQEEYTWLPRDTTYGRRMYTAPDGFQIQVSGVLMGTDRTSIHKPEYCLPAQGFRILRNTKTDIRIERPHPYRLPVVRMDAVREGKRPDGTTFSQSAVYVFWFLSDTRLSNDHAQRMWWLAMDLARTGELQRWAYMGCLVASPPGREDEAYARLVRFLQEAVPQFQLTTGPALSEAGVMTSHPRAAVAAALPGVIFPPDR